MAVLTDPAECGPGDAGACARTRRPRPTTIPQSFFAERVWTPRRIRPDEGELAGGGRIAEECEEALDRRGRRRALLRGGAARLRISPSATASRWPRRRPASRASPTIIPRNHGRDRRHRHRRRQRARRGGRRRARGRHAAAGFHHRLLGAVQEPAAPHRRPQRAGLRRRRSTRRSRSSPMPASASKSFDGALPAGRRLRRGRSEPKTRRRDGLEAAARYTAATNAALPSDAQVIGAVQRASRARRYRRLRRGRLARRTAQALAGARSRAATTSNTAIPAWATRSPAGSA